MLSPVKICMNGLCGATTTHQWKKGWPMKAGGFATLCYSCGNAYDSVRYCEQFHLNEPGWRECKHCDKPVHCGCVVSKYLYECLDVGGISCKKCTRAKGIQPFKQPAVHEISNGFARFSSNWQPTVFTNRMNNETNFEKHRHKSSGEFITRCSSSIQNPLPDNNKPNFGPKSIYEPLPQQSSGFNLGNLGSSLLPTSNGLAEGKVHGKVSSFKQMLSRPLKSGVSMRSKSNKGSGSDNQVARPPAEGRGRSQLLPRYWPKITEQELLQISGDLNSNSTITPLFEKVLSASDAGRIGRLVLPKACAEAYFPPINQSDGLPIKIQDIKGKEWTFQFRFWPNNNSRMYVLEGVTPCIQNMQLQAGDIVIFSRLDPENKLVIGCRKTTISAEASTLPNPINVGPLNGNSPTNMEHEGTSKWDSVINEKKKTRNIGSKSKRLHMHSEDAMELKFTWEEAQELLRPPSSKPTVVVIENCELEEYDEPPVFGKKTIFTMNASQLQEQWVQCDNCSKRRKLPLDVLIPSNWICSDNVSDPNRCSCSVPEERGVAELDRILRFEFKKPQITEILATEEQQLGPTGLDALATLAVLGENPNEQDESLVGPTTRHPRHRPGCSCIVCIQPPSGKGKHKPNCICNVCSTVRRRFKTLMLRKRKRMSEQEDEMVQKSLVQNDLGEGLGTGTGPEMLTESSNKGQVLDLNFDPKEEEMMIAAPAPAPAPAPDWENVLGGLVHNGTSDDKDGPVLTNNKVVEGS